MIVSGIVGTIRDRIEEINVGYNCVRQRHISVSCSLKMETRACVLIRPKARQTERSKELLTYHDSLADTLTRSTRSTRPDGTLSPHRSRLLPQTTRRRAPTRTLRALGTFNRGSALDDLPSICTTVPAPRAGERDGTEDRLCEHDKDKILAQSRERIGYQLGRAEVVVCRDQCRVDVAILLRACRAQERDWLCCGCE